MVYSIRMRAAKGGPHEQGGSHISGAERLVSLESLSRISEEFLQRALQHSKGRPDFINLQIDEIPDDSIVKVPALMVATTKSETIEDSHRVATQLLRQAQIHEQAIRTAFSKLSENTETVSGAWLINATTGEA